MSTISSPDIKKKRKKDSGTEPLEGSLAAKSLKLYESIINEKIFQKSESSSSQSSNSQCSSSFKTDSQASSVTSLIPSKDLNEENGSSSFPEFKTQSSQKVLQSSTTLQQIPSTLNLLRGNVYRELMEAFSQEPVPDHLTFEDEPLNLSDALDEFWRELLADKNLFKGNNIKVANNTWSENKIIAKVLRVGWEKAHYFPKKLSSLFLERCLFNREKPYLEASADMLLQFVDEEDSTILSRALCDSNTVSSETVSAILLKYNVSYSFEPRSREETFKSAAIKVMVDDPYYAIEIWSEEVKGMMNYEEFLFLTTLDYDLKVNSVMYGCRAPHTLWRTFLFDFQDNSRFIDFYKDRISNVDLSTEICCRDEILTTKHYLCSCDKSVGTMRKERHDVVMKLIVKQLKKAIKLKKGIFHTKQWRVHVMFGNKHVGWPNDLSNVMGWSRLRPHIVVYTVNPLKKMLIIEPKISWENDLDIRKSEKEMLYGELIEDLTHNNIDVTFEAIVMGCRGVVPNDLYNLFVSTFGLSQEKAARTIEKISKKIIKVAYNFLPK